MHMDDKCTSSREPTLVACCGLLQSHQPAKCSVEMGLGLFTPYSADGMQDPSLTAQQRQCRLSASSVKVNRQQLQYHLTGLHAVKCLVMPQLQIQ